MKLQRILLLTGLLSLFVSNGEEGWKLVDEGFQSTIPSEWQRQKVHPIDSNAGSYKGERADLEFDELFGLGYTAKKSKLKIQEMERKRANPNLLKKGEEIWRVGGRLADFSCGKVDPKVYGQRRFTNVARLFIPYEGQAGYLDIFILYQSDEDLPTAKRVLKSIEWQKKKPNKRAGLDAGFAVVFAFGRGWSGITHRERWAGLRSESIHK